MTREGCVKRTCRKLFLAMATLAEALALAVQHHQAGELQSAEQIYRQILAVNPNHVDSLHLLGVIALQTSQYDSAVTFIRRAIELGPAEPAFHINLGNAFEAQGKPDEALASYCRALALNPNDGIANYNLANTLQSQGRLDDAAAAYRRTLELNPNHAEALNNLGNALKNQGKLTDAVGCFQRALELKPNYPEALKNLGETFQAQGKLDDTIACLRNAQAQMPDSAELQSNLGNAYQAQGKLDEAIESYRRALNLKPDFAVAHYNLGIALKSDGKLDDAIASYRQALQLKPDFPEAHHNLGRVYEAQGKLDDAAACYRRTLELNPQFSEAHNNLGNILCALGKPDEALPYYRRAVELKPNFHEAYSNLGNALRALGKLDEAIAFCRHALKLNPNNAEAYNNLGNTFQVQGKLPEAVESYRRAMELKPADADAHSNLGSALQQWGQIASATTCYAQALQLNPNCAFAHYGLATLNLLHGRFETGWPEFEWRWRTNPVGPREFPTLGWAGNATPGWAGKSVLRWDGNPLANRTILLHAEEVQGGLGDTIQFVRYAALIKKQNPAATVIVECQRSLAKLLARCPGIDRLIARGGELPPFDVHAPLMSVPGILKTSLETIPAKIPYLFADPLLVDEWRKKLDTVRGLRIGIAWRARPVTRHRNIPLECFTRLADLPGVKLIGLQKGARLELSAGRENVSSIVDLGDDFDATHGAFMDTAAVMMNLDLVISSDTAIPHLACALGVPVWLAVSIVPDWRWLLDRGDSPWYPTMRLFRQKTPGDWNGVFDEILAALHTA